MSHVKAQVLMGRLGNQSTGSELASNAQPGMALIIDWARHGPIHVGQQLALTDGMQQMMFVRAGQKRAIAIRSAALADTLGMYLDGR